MKKVFILSVDYCYHGDTENEILGVFGNEDDARKAMEQEFAKDMEESWIANYFENGEFLADVAEEDGVTYINKPREIAVEKKLLGRVHYICDNRENS